MKKFISMNPATGEVMKVFDELSDAELEKKIALAQARWLKWRETTYTEREVLMTKLAKLLHERKQEYGAILTKEMGKPVTQAVAEVEKCAWVCEYYAAETEKIVAPEAVKTDATESFVSFEPLGAVLAVMPWNYAFWQVMRFAAPAVMAGNVGLLKHASNVPQSAQALEQIFLDAGFPAGVFQNLFVSSARVEALISDARVKAVTLTGSEAAGMKVGAAAGREIKPSVMELGGSDPFIILADADVEAACAIGVTARLQNNGQSCIAAKRFIVVAERAEEFIKIFKAKFEALKIGDPLDVATQIGPLASEQGLQDIAKQVESSVAAGATLVCGGKRVGEKGWFYAPTILADVKPGMSAYDEEMFGPVASVITVKDADEAVKVANDTRFGLGASIWTKSTETAKKLIPRLEAGAVFVNGLVKSDPRLPFGGSKKSGYGRELAAYGMKAFMNIKTVWIK